MIAITTVQIFQRPPYLRYVKPVFPLEAGLLRRWRFSDRGARKIWAYRARQAPLAARRLSGVTSRSSEGNTSSAAVAAMRTMIAVRMPYAREHRHRGEAHYREARHARGMPMR